MAEPFARLQNKKELSLGDASFELAVAAEVEATSELLFQRSNSGDLEPEIVKMDRTSCTGQEACDKMEISLSLWTLEILDFKTC